MLMKRLRNLLLFLLFVFIVIMGVKYINTPNPREQALQEFIEEQARIQKLNEQIAADTQRRLEEELAIETQRRLEEEKLREKIVNSNNFVSSISDEIEVIVFKQSGNYTISHDRTPKNNWYNEWLINAELTIKLDYNILFSMMTKDIKFTVTPEGAVNASYEASKIAITALETSNVIPMQTTSVFGSKYKPTEVAALEDIAKDQIKELTYTQENISKASNNLESFIYDFASKFGIEEITVTENSQDIEIKLVEAIPKDNQGN